MLQHIFEALNNKETMSVKTDFRDEVTLQQSKPMEELVDISLKEPGKSVKIGSELPIVIREELESFLRSNSNVFTWTHEDMLGICPSVIVHQLNVNKSAKSIKQKQRSFAPKRNQATANEVEKLLQADFIREVHYSEWLANVVLVKKV